jgi:heme A synthase
MKAAYRVLAYLVAIGVAVQAASIAYGFFGLVSWVEQGGTFDQSNLRGSEVGGHIGFLTHGIGGVIVVPAIALLFLISSFFAKIPGGLKWALIVFGVTVLQVGLGLLSLFVAGLGWLHGLNALALFGTAMVAGTRVPRAVAARTAATEEPIAESALT